MIRIFDTLLEDGTWTKRAFNIDYIVAARPVDIVRPGIKESVIISNLFGEFEVRGSLEDLLNKEDIDPLQVFSGAATGE